MLLWFATSCDHAGGCTRVWGRPVQQSRGEASFSKWELEEFCFNLHLLRVWSQSSIQEGAEHLPPSP